MDTLEKAQRLANAVAGLPDNQSAEISVMFIREMAATMERMVARLKTLEENVTELEAQRDIADSRTVALYAELRRWNARLQRVQAHLVAVHLALELDDDRPTQPGGEVQPDTGGV